MSNTPGGRDARESAQIVLEKLTRSKTWMEDNFYGEYEQVTRQYYAMPPPIVDPERERSASTHSTDTSRWLGLFDANGREIRDDAGGSRGDDVPNFYAPDQWALVRRKTARATSAIPNLRFIGSDWDRGNRVSRTCMWQWDTMDRARDHKRHVATAFLYGWSVKLWYWVRNTSMRTEKVNPFNATPEQLQRVMEYYSDNVQQFAQEIVAQGADPQSDGDAINQYVIGKLMETYGVGQYLRYRYPSVGYVGPRYDTVFITDLFPQPNCRYLQAGWLCVVRRRPRRWFEKLRESYQELAEEMENGNARDYDPETVRVNLDQIDAMFEKYPKGSKPEDIYKHGGRDHANLTERLLGAANRTLMPSDQYAFSNDVDDAEWSVVEVHHPGGEDGEARVEYCAEGEFYFGKLPYTFDLGDGLIPATELVFIDAMLPGPGDSTARILRKIVEEHGKHESLKMTLVRDVLRPLARVPQGSGLFDNPNLLRRGPYGTRIIESDMPIEPISDQNAMAAIGAGMQANQSFMQMIQYGSGESNMSMMANVDPQQARTATGARIMAFSQDVLTQEELAMLNISIRADVGMMRRLNRSELVDELSFDESPYMRGADLMKRAQQDPAAGQAMQETVTVNNHGLPAIVSVTPEDFQIDGEIEPEVGSTLAEDDELNVHRAQLLWQIAMQAAQGGLINLRRALAYILISLGQGKHINEWILPEQPQVQQPDPAQARVNFNVNIGARDLLDPATGVENGPAVLMQLISMLQQERAPKEAPQGEGAGGGIGEGASLSTDGIALEPPGSRGPDTAYEAGVGHSNEM